eukprot:4966674-Lingulodinium_polyedra.AAC.1
MPGDMTLRLPVVMCPPRSFRSPPGRRPSSHCSSSDAPARGEPFGQPQRHGPGQWPVVHDG